MISVWHWEKLIAIFFLKEQEAEALVKEAGEKGGNALNELKDAVQTSWEKTKSDSVGAGERFAKYRPNVGIWHVWFWENIEKFTILAHKTVETIDSSLKGTEDAAANLLGHLSLPKNQTYDLQKNE